MKNEFEIMQVVKVIVRLHESAAGSICNIPDDAECIDYAIGILETLAAEKRAAGQDHALFGQAMMTVRQFVNEYNLSLSHGDVTRLGRKASSISRRLKDSPVPSGRCQRGKANSKIFYDTNSYREPILLQAAKELGLWHKCAQAA